MELGRLPSLSLVIVAWHSSDDLERLLPSILPELDYVHEIILVNNEGTLSASCLDAIHSLSASVISPPSNLGFARACNLASDGLTSDFIVFLNPDTLIIPGTFSRLLHFLSSSPLDLGSCGIGLLGRSSSLNNHCCRFPEFFDFLYEFLLLASFFPRLSYTIQSYDSNQPQRVDHVIGAFYCVPRSLFLALGGFDPRYSVYMEDLDLSLRLSLIGRQCYFLPYIKSYHFSNASRKVMPFRSLLLSFNSKLKYIYKHFSFSRSLVLSVLAICVYLPAKLMFFGVRYLLGASEKAK